MLHLLSMYLFTLMVIVFVFNMQTIFFVELYPSETRKLMERLVNYVIYKVTFLTDRLSGTYLILIHSTLMC